MDRLIERQEMRELTQLDDGIRRYHKEMAAREVGDVKAGLGLVYVAMKRIVPWIETNVGLLEDGKTHPSQVPLAVHWLCEMNAEAVAYITAKICVSASYNEAKVLRTSMRIANLIEENYRYEELEQNEPNLANSMSRKAARWSKARTRRKIMRKAADVGGVKRMGWTETEKAKLGHKLVEVFILETGLAENKLVRDSGGSKHSTNRILTMTEGARERIEQRNAQLEDLDPVHRPMVCPPKPWTTPINGGYLTERMKTPILRGAAFRKVTEGLLDELFSTDLTQVYDAVNAVQGTAWQINKPILDLIEEAWRGDMALGGIPEADPRPLPPLPAGLPEYEKGQQLDEKQQAQLDKWKGEARTMHQFNAAQQSQRVALVTKLVNARDVANEEAIYFPHALDFRGRIYPMSAELSPQSDDISKALLQFSKGKPLGESGAYWLHVHLSNLYGYDKESFDARVQWVKDNEENITRSAASPLDHLWWTDADEPWCFLAACMEYVGYLIEGDEYVSHLPIAMDGSCSGLQHYSAMLRDPRGAHATNLTATDKPTDLYTQVQEVVNQRLAESSEPLAKVWAGKVTRKIVKRPCMTFAYGVTSAGIKNQLLDELRKSSRDAVGKDDTFSDSYLPGVSNWESAVMLAPIIEQAIMEVVECAAEARDWLKSVSKQVSKAGVPTGWTTPLGFRVLQPYLKSRGKRIKVLFNGTVHFLSLTFEGDDIHANEQSLGVSPNFVHSLDATHMMMTVNRLAPVTDSFAMIHDSFGVHACDVDELHYALRDEFIKLYEQDVLVNFYQESLLRLPGGEWPKVPSPPEAGEFNLEEVRDADFFFA